MSALGAALLADDLDAMSAAPEPSEEEVFDFKYEHGDINLVWIDPEGDEHRSVVDLLAVWSRSGDAYDAAASEWPKAWGEFEDAMGEPGIDGCYWEVVK